MKKLLIAGFLIAGALTITGCSTNSNNITIDEVRTSQTDWGRGLTDISWAYRNGYDFEAVASDVFNSLYGHDYDYVLFNGMENPLKNSTGLDYISVLFEEGMLITNGNQALWTGRVHMANSAGEVTTVEKTFGYFRDTNGDLRINLQHSSLPFND